MTHGLLALMFTLTLVACSSPIRKADKLMESGNFQEAIAVLEQASAQSPRDEEILAKLREAKTKLVQRKFIDVRLARMSGDHEGALNLLSEALDQREQWSSSVGQQAGGVQVTIEEESEYARPVLRRRLDQLAGQPLPWPMLKERRQHRILYAELQADWRKRIETAEKKKANDTCTKLGLEKSSETPFYNRWIDQLCSPWNIRPNPAQPIDPKTLNWTGTFTGVDFQYVDEGPKNRVLKIIATIAAPQRPISSELAAASRNAFQSSPWLGAASNAQLSIEGRGHFLERDSRRTETRTANFDEPKTVEVRDPSGTVRRESHVERQQIRFPVDIVERTYELEASLSSNPGGRPIAWNFRQQKIQRDETHQTRDGRAGIAPDPLEFSDSGPWINEQVEAITKQWALKLEEAWNEAYCSGDSPFQLKAEENFSRCFQTESARKKDGSALSQFTRDHFGLAPAALAALFNEK